MNIQYEPSKADTRAGLAHCWSTVTGFRSLVLFIGAIGAVLGFSLAYSTTHAVTVFSAIASIVFAVGMPWLLRRQLIASTKSGVRRLAIDRDGITTEIGHLSGALSWSQVLRIDANADHVFIIGKTFNFFALPIAAFTDDEERKEFIRRAQLYHANAT